MADKASAASPAATEHSDVTLASIASPAATEHSDVTLASAVSLAATEHSYVTPLQPPPPEPCFLVSRPQKAQRLVQQASTSNVLVFRSAESESWAGQRMTLLANGLVEIDGSPPHGSWFKQTSVSCDDILHIDFHCTGDPSKIKRHMFIRVTGTDCYEMMSCAGGSKPTRATLMPLAIEPVVWLTPGRTSTDTEYRAYVGGVWLTLIKACTDTVH